VLLAVRPLTRLPLLIPYLQEAVISQEPLTVAGLGISRATVICEIVARVGAILTGNSSSKAGVMMRDSLAANSIEASVLVSTGGG